MVNASLDHSICMGQLAHAGIYVLVDLAAPGFTISSNNPVWNHALYDRFTAVIDAMHNHTNLLGFIVGDNVIQGVDAQGSGPYVKAAVRDMKTYIQQKEYRSIPVGYVNDVIQPDHSDLTPQAKDAWEYLACNNEMNRIDFFGGNIASFCSGSTYEDSGYKEATEQLSDYPIPVFLASYGCSRVTNRDWSEIPIIYGNNMSSVWSGGIVYQHFQQSYGVGYGLVNVLGTSSTNNLFVTPQDSFGNISSRIATVSPSRVNLALYTPAKTATVTCPPGAATSLPLNPRRPVNGEAAGAGTSSSAALAAPTTTTAATQAPIAAQKPLGKAYLPVQKQA